MVVFDAVKEVLSKSFNLRFIGVHIILAIILIVISTILNNGISALMFSSLVPFSSGSLQFFSYILSNFWFLFWIFLPIFFVLAVIYELIYAFVNGIQFNLGKDFLQKNSFSLGKAFNAMKPRLVTGFLVRLVFFIIFSIIILLWLIPLSGSLMNLLNQISSNPLLLIIPSPKLFVGIIGWVFVGLIIALVIGLMLLPFWALLFQIPFYEKLSALACIKKAWQLTMKNYSQNWLLAFLAGLVLAIISIIIFIIIMIIFMILVFLGQALGGIATTVLIILAIITLLILMTAWISWMLSFESLFAAKIYSLNTSFPKTTSTKIPSTKTPTKTPKKFFPTKTP